MEKIIRKFTDNGYTLEDKKVSGGTRLSKGRFSVNVHGAYVLMAYDGSWRTFFASDLESTSVTELENRCMRHFSMERKEHFYFNLH